MVALVDQYLAHVAQARRLRLELAADYLVMAAWLAYLKSRLLLPEPPAGEEPSGQEMADALQWQAEGLFDAVLLDAPCSATGTIRRHPDLPFVKDGSELAELTDLQSRLIDHALSLVKPGGRLVFCTCSLLPEEGEAQLHAALARHPGLTVERRDLAGVQPDWWTPEGSLRLRPDYWADLGGMDGFFMVRLRKG